LLPLAALRMRLGIRVNYPVGRFLRVPEQF
jgi:hypothetical protein